MTTDEGRSDEDAAPSLEADAEEEEASPKTRILWSVGTLTGSAACIGLISANVLPLALEYVVQIAASPSPSAFRNS